MSRAQEGRARRMVQAAAGLFLRKGYQLNMTEVALAAGVARQTVYTHFGSKHALLEAAVGELIAPLRETLDAGQHDLRGGLVAFGRAHLERALNPRTATLARRLIAEAARFPQEAKALYESGIGSVQRLLAKRLARAHAEGELAIASPERAAEMLIGLINGLDGDRRRLGLPVRGPGARKRWIDDTIDFFLRAHRVGPPALRKRRTAQQSSKDASS
jgi:AcrR family transcriptional regulator